MKHLMLCHSGNSHKRKVENNIKKKKENHTDFYMVRLLCLQPRGQYNKEKRMQDSLTISPLISLHSFSIFHEGR